jgi:hypothetical protein
MSLTVRDAEDSWLAGKRRWDKYLSEFDARWNAPKVMEDVVLFINQVPPEVMAALPPDVRNRLSKLRKGVSGNAPEYKTQSQAQNPAQAAALQMGAAGSQGYEPQPDYGSPGES